jgi:glycosyltransferase involved in cell wall biosynthesis
MRDTEQQVRVSVVIPCRDHHEELDRCLRSLRGQATSVPYEIVVVDAGRDARVAAVADAHPGVRVVRGGGELSAGEARNLGAGESRGRDLGFIDADCTAEPGWVSALARALEGGARLAGGPVLQGRPWHPVSFADNLLQFVDFPAARPEGEAVHFPGCNAALARDDFDALGGFPTSDVPAGEDVLFSVAAGKRWPGGNRFVPGMRVRHFGRTTPGALFRHHETFGYWRARLDLLLNPAHKRLGRSIWMIVPVMLKRLAYIAHRTARWNPAGLVALVLLLPLLVFGLAGWAIGFRRGCREAAA